VRHAAPEDGPMGEGKCIRCSDLQASSVRPQLQLQLCVCNCHLKNSSWHVTELSVCNKAHRSAIRHG
jgi:hypothetical protein